MKTENLRQVKNDEVHVGLPVYHKAAPKAVAFHTEIITAPRQHKGALCVNVAMIGDPVPIAELYVEEQVNEEQP